MGMNQIDDDIRWKDSSLLNCLVNDVKCKIAISECRSPSLTNEKENSLNSDSLADNWRFPELNEVIADLGSCDDEVKLNAAAYLQHLAYRNDCIKSNARELNAFLPLIEMLFHSNHEVVRSALGALRNLSCGKANDLNKIEIMKNDGIRILVNVIKTSHNHSVVEMASGLLWNLSSCPALKEEILQRSLDVMFNYIIMPLLCCISTDTSQPPHKLSFSNFRHATGVLRNVSSTNRESRTRLQQHGGVSNSLLSFVTWSSKHRDVDEKSVENCLCVLRNLSHNLEDLCLDGPVRSRSLGRKTDTRKSIHDSPSASCFRSKRNSKCRKSSMKFSSTDDCLGVENNSNFLKLMMRQEIITILIHLLQTHQNNVDICESVLGIIQNLCFPNLQPSLDILESLRKCQGLPVVIQNLTMSSDKVVVAACVVLKILTTDQINQDIIGGVIMNHLLNRPPPCKHESPYSVETHNFLSLAVCECIGPNVAFARNVLITGGVKQLTNVILSPNSFGIRASQLASIILRKMWSFQEMHEEMKVRGLRKVDFMIEPPKKTSMESLDSCINELEGRSKKVRFVEVSSAGEGTSGCHNPSPNMVPAVPNTPPLNPAPSTTHKLPQWISTTSTSNTFPRPCHSFCSIKSQHLQPFRMTSSSSPCFSQHQRPFNSNIFFPCCYPSRPTIANPSTIPLVAVQAAGHSSDSTTLVDSLISSEAPISSTSTLVTSHPNQLFTPANSWV